MSSRSALNSNRYAKTAGGLHQLNVEIRNCLVLGCQREKRIEAECHPCMKGLHLPVQPEDLRSAVRAQNISVIRLFWERCAAAPLPLPVTLRQTSLLAPIKRRESQPLGTLWCHRGWYGRKIALGPDEIGRFS